MSESTAAKRVEGQNLIDFKCFRKCKFITLQILVGLSHCGIRGTNGLMGMTFLAWMAGEMGGGGLLTPGGLPLHIDWFVILCWRQ